MISSELVLKHVRLRYRFYLDGPAITPLFFGKVKNVLRI